jgi:uridine kinase
MQTTFDGVSRLKFDDFFKDAIDVPMYKDWHLWDDPQSIKWTELVQAAKDLKANRPAIVPNYSRTEDKTVGEKCVFPAPIILIDGYQCLCNPELCELMDLKLYFHLSEGSQLRRRRERQPWVKEGYLYETMLPYARTYLFPTKEFADHVINAEMSVQGVADQCIGIVTNRLGDRLKKLGSRERFQTVKIFARV